MATLNPVIVPAKALKGGRHKIRIAVAHNGTTRYLVTEIIIDSAKEFKNGIIVKRPDAAILNTRLRGIIQTYQESITELGYIEGLTCPELITQMKNVGDSKHRTLTSIYEEFVASKQIKSSSIKQYKIVWHNIEKCLGGSTLVEHISRSSILALSKYLKDKKLSTSSIKNTMAFMMGIVNFAKKCGYAQYRVDPFVGYSLPKSEVRQAWISVDEIKKIRDLNIEKKNVAKCRDIFMLSYYLGGINMADLLKINFMKDSKTLHYVRQKTENISKINEFVEFSIPDEAQAILKRLINKDGFIDIPASERKRLCHNFFRTNMPHLAKLAGLKHLIYYTARKSFAQHAYELEIPESVIDYILGHKVNSGGEPRFAYIYVTPEKATKAVRKVLDNLK